LETSDRRNLKRKKRRLRVGGWFPILVFPLLGIQRQEKESSRPKAWEAVRLFSRKWEKKRGVFPSSAIETRKDRFDAAARVMVVFGRGKVFRIMGGAEPSGFRIEYIWASHLPKNHTFDHPGEKYCKVFVLESGEGKAGQWVSEKRNLHKDYKSAFGTDPEGVSAIGIQTDTDHSNEMVTAYYSHPILRKK
jgi:hypothetical protein